MDEAWSDRFRELRESDQDDPEIQYEIGLCYLKGDGVKQNGQEAQTWLKRSADQGYAPAIELLENAGQGQEKQGLPPLSEETLLDWCAAAEDGDAEAQYQVALYF